MVTMAVLKAKLGHNVILNLEKLTTDLDFLKGI